MGAPDLTKPEHNELVPTDDDPAFEGADADGISPAELAEYEEGEAEDGDRSDLTRPENNPLIPDSARVELADGLAEQLSTFSDDEIVLGEIRIQKMASGSFTVAADGKSWPLRQAPARLLLRIRARLEK